MNEKLKMLEQRVGELLAICDELIVDNKKLAAQRDELARKTDEVHSRISSMIDEIRALEGQV